MPTGAAFSAWNRETRLDAIGTLSFKPSQSAATRTGRLPVVIWPKVFLCYQASEFGPKLQQVLDVTHIGWTSKITKKREVAFKDQR